MSCSSRSLSFLEGRDAGDRTQASRVLGKHSSPQSHVVSFDVRTKDAEGW